MASARTQAASPASTGPPGAPRESAISVSELVKTFRLPHHRYSTLKERVVDRWRRSAHDELRALDGVSFDVARGEFLGVVGRNGSGKSTLLKCLAGIYEPNAGRIDVRGRVSPFIDLGVGFNPELSAADNVIISGIMLGLTRREATRRFDEIIAFAELEEFVDVQLKNYSSGMVVRLAFAVALEVQADIMLVDEVLAVGDAAFAQKCFDEFTRVRELNRTMVLVTHDMRAVELFCDRALLLERGVPLSLDTPDVVAARYNEINFGREVDPSSGGERFGDQETAEIVEAWFEDADGFRVAAIDQGELCCMRFEVKVHRPLSDPALGVILVNGQGVAVLATNTIWRDMQTGEFEPGDRVVVRVALEAWFAPGRYWLTGAIAQGGTGADFIDMRFRLTSIVVRGTIFSGAVIDPPHEFDLERRPPAPA